MRDINYLIAIDTRYVGEAAAEREDDGSSIELVAPVHELLPARDAQREGRAHRLQRAEPVPAARRGDAPRRRTTHALAGVGYMKYYGRTSYEHEARRS